MSARSRRLRLLPSEEAATANRTYRCGMDGIRRQQLAVERLWQHLAKRYGVQREDGLAVDPTWLKVSQPLLGAGWEEDEVLLWMACPHVLLNGLEPAALLDVGEVGPVEQVVAREALGTC